MRQAVREHTAPGSAAPTYLTHLDNIADAALDGGTPFNARTLSRDGESLVPHYRDGETSTFADFKICGGKVSDLTINGEVPGST